MINTFTHKINFLHARNFEGGTVPGTFKGKSPEKSTNNSIFARLREIMEQQPSETAIVPMNAAYGFTLTRQQWSSPLGLYFRHSTDGTLSSERTEVKLMFDEVFFHIDFACHDNPFTHQNHMKEHNAPLYNQEVFEVFISEGEQDPVNYLEIEINPNNALWIGRIKNPSLGTGGGNSTEMISYNDSGIMHQVSLLDNTWSGRISIPWKLIGEQQPEIYRLNFYRIVSVKSHQDQNWKCNKQDCHFLCWSPTMSGKDPAFHRPKKFGRMQLKK